MKNCLKRFCVCFTVTFFMTQLSAQKNLMVQVLQSENENKVDVFIGNKLFTSFLYPDTLEKPVLFPVYAADETMITRGFPLHPSPGDPTDHPHHTGIWFTYENVNGIDFWNNSYAIPKDKKNLYGWIKTDSVTTISGNKRGTIIYHANWIDQHKDVLLEETTYLNFSGTGDMRIIDRETILKADTLINFTDAKDGLYAIRLAPALEIPDKKEKEFKDGKGNVTQVKASKDIATGNYLTSEGRTGDSAWSTRGNWCKVYGKIKNDSISIVIIDNPENPDYPTFWHARGYGLFSANPLGAKAFTNGKSSENLHLKRGETVTFRYRIVIQDGKETLSSKKLDELANEFAKENH